jgi:hypothetical protein
MEDSNAAGDSNCNVLHLQEQLRFRESMNSDKLEFRNVARLVHHRRRLQDEL